MADTGAPYFIPYVEPTDLVRDYPAADEASADAIAAALDAIPVLAGIGSNVVQADKQDTFSTTSSSFEDVPGLEVTITPSSATAKILLIADVKLGQGVGDQQVATITFTGGNANDYQPTSGGIRQGIAGTGRSAPGAGWRQEFGIMQAAAVYLDSPATTSAVTYKVQLSASGGTAHVNRIGGTNDSTRTASSLTAIEVAA